VSLLPPAPVRAACSSRARSSARYASRKPARKAGEVVACREAVPGTVAGEVAAGRDPPRCSEVENLLPGGGGRQVVRVQAGGSLQCPMVQALQVVVQW